MDPSSVEPAELGPDASDDALRGAVAEALQRLAPDATRVLVAVSGGGDSLALLSLLRGVAPAGAALEIIVGHVDHALRPGSRDDAAAVQALAESWGFAAATRRIDVAAVAEANGWNLEDAARRLRYDALHRMARDHGADVVAVAHTRDDQAETVLMQLLRGAAFLCGMPARRGRVVRPLLSVSRRALRGHLRRHDLEPRVDATNRDTSRLRAAVRHDLLPELDAVAPGVAVRLARLAIVQRDQRDALEHEARRRFGTEALALGALAKAPAALQRTAVALLLREAGAPIDFGTLEAIRARLLEDDPGASWRRDVGRGVRVRAHGGRLEALRVARSEAPVDEGPLTQRRRAALAADPPPPAALLADAELETDSELWWRARRPGDRITLPGGTTKVADLMIDRKIPRERRDRIPLIARGAEVLWIEGVATASTVPHTPEDEPADREREAMAEALTEARAAGAAGEIPVGAVVLGPGGETLARAQNRTRRESDPSAHAEVLALRSAARQLGDWRLAGCTLVVTLEPCAMCYGAALNAHVSRIVWGASNLRDGALGSVVDLAAAPTKRHPSLRGGVRAAECRRGLEAFFAEQR